LTFLDGSASERLLDRPASALPWILAGCAAAVSPDRPTGWRHPTAVSIDLPDRGPTLINPLGGEAVTNTSLPAQNPRLRGDPKAPHFGLPSSLHVPIAAASIEAIDTFVGDVLRERLGREGRPKALLVQTPPRSVEAGVPLWTSAAADLAMQRLHPPLQVWVDVDYAAYRRAYLSFGLTMPPGYFLDHIQNRRAMRLRGRSHPWLRLCPVHRRVNTSGGSPVGGEGMEYEYLAGALAAGLSFPEHQVIYADPMDLTKMLDVEPGTRPLDGVRDTQALFYP
jgi:hypothetical protein